MVVLGPWVLLGPGGVPQSHAFTVAQLRADAGFRQAVRARSDVEDAIRRSVRSGLTAQRGHIDTFRCSVVVRVRLQDFIDGVIRLDAAAEPRAEACAETLYGLVWQPEAEGTKARVGRLVLAR